MGVLVNPNYARQITPNRIAGNDEFNGRAANCLTIPNAAARSVHIHPSLLVENLQSALLHFDSLECTARTRHFWNVANAPRESACSLVKTDKIALITWIGFDPVGLAAKPTTVKTDEITLITLTGFDPVGLAAAPSTVKTDKITLITWIGYDSHPWRALSKSIPTLSGLRRFDGLKAQSLPRGSPLSGLPFPVSIKVL